MADLKVMFTTMIIIFLAEFGDKTQLVAVAQANQSTKLWPVLVGVCAGLSLAGVVGVLAAHILVKIIDPRYIKIGSGMLFVLIGTWMIFSKSN